ncbi:MAG TPA: DUF1707 domain-containing protein [Streptosporangiaceae bacterium]|nr:DUF1707 domain-containing protein [Streptosporangiaceae bacterium]
MNTRVPGSADYSAQRGTGPRPAGSSRARGFPGGTLRVSDADRDAALAELTQHYEAGRLTTEELDERTGAILAARTGTELESQLTDLPVLGVPAAAPPEHRPARPGPNLAPGLVLAVVVAAVVAVVLTLSAGHAHGVHSWNAAIPVLIGVLVLRRLAGRR